MTITFKAISNALWYNLKVAVFLKYRHKEIEYIPFRLQIILNANSATTKCRYLLGEILHLVRRNTRLNLAQNVCTNVSFLQWHCFKLELVPPSSVNDLILWQNSAISMNVFTVFSIISNTGSALQFPLSEFHFDSRNLCSVPKAEGGHVGYPTATYHASWRAGR